MKDESQDVIAHERVISASETRSAARLHCHKHSRLWWIAHLMVVPMLMIVLSALWLATGSRSIPFMTTFIEQELNRQVAPMVMHIEDVRMRLDASKGTLVAEVRNVNVRDAERPEALHFPAIKMRMVTRPLLRGRLKLRELGIVNPVVMIQRDEDGTLDLRLSSEEEGGEVQKQTVTKSSSNVAIAEILTGLQRLGLRSVTLENGKIRLIDKGRSTLLRAPMVTVGVRRMVDGMTEIDADIALLLANKSSSVQGKILLHGKGKEIDVQMQWQDLPLVALAAIHPQLSMFSGATLSVTGALQAQLDANASLQTAQVSILKGEGVLKDGEFFVDGLQVDTFKAQLSVTQNGDEVALKKLYIKTPKGTFFEGTATATRAAQMHDVIDFIPFLDVYVPEMDGIEEDSGYVVDAKLHVYRAFLDDLKHFWPAPLAPMSRAWVVQNISQGTIPQAELTIHLTPEMMTQRPLPPAFLSAAIQVEKAKVRYLSHMPAITDISGVVRFTGNSLEVDAVTGNTLQATSLKKAYVAIPDFFDMAHGIPLVVDAELISDGRDIATAMDQEHLHLGQSIQLRPDALIGKAEGRIQLHLPLYSDAIPNNTKPYDELVVYQVDATLDGVTQNKIQGKWDVADLKGSFLAKNGEVLLDADAKLSGVPLKLMVHNTLVTAAKDASQKDSYETRYHVQGKMTPQQLQQLGVGKIPLVEGVLGVDAEVLEADSKPTITKGKIDLRDADVQIPVLAWHKPRGVEAKADFTHQADDKKDMLTGLVLKASGIYLQGDVDIAKSDGEVKRIALSQFRYGRSDMNVNYTLDAQRVAHVVLRGAVADATPWVGDDPEDGVELTPEQKKQLAEPIDDPLKKLENIDIDMDVARLEMGRKRMFERFVAQLSCREICRNVDVSAATKGGKPFAWRIQSVNGKRTLSASTPDAGEVLHVLGVSPHVHDGALELHGEFDDATTKHLFSGSFLMTDFTLTDAPILTRLLSLMSFSGLTNALTGNGIGFAKMSMNTQYADGELAIDTGKAYGSAVGITIKGSLQPFAKKTNFEGTLVPAYAANSILGNIPVLGTLLTGGEGGGIIAANFSIKGNSSDPSVMVNPLSLLTPGFLRKLFDIGS